MSLSFFQMCQLLENVPPAQQPPRRRGLFGSQPNQPPISVQQVGIQPPVTDLATDPNSTTRVTTKTDVDPNSLVGQTIGPIGDKISRRVTDIGRDPKRERGPWDVSGSGPRTKDVGPAAANDDHFVSPFQVGGKDQSKIKIGNTDFAGQKLYRNFMNLINKKQLDLSKRYNAEELVRLFAPMMPGQADPNYLKSFITKLTQLPAPPLKLVGNSGGSPGYMIVPPKPSEAPLAGLSPIARQKALDPDEDRLSKNRERGLPYANPALHGGEADTVGSPQDYDDQPGERQQSQVIADLLTSLSGLHHMFDQEWGQAMQTGDGEELKGYLDEIQAEFEKADSLKNVLEPEDLEEISKYFNDIKSKYDQFVNSHGDQAPTSPASQPGQQAPSSDLWDDDDSMYS